MAKTESQVILFKKQMLTLKLQKHKKKSTKIWWNFVHLCFCDK